MSSLLHFRSAFLSLNTHLRLLLSFPTRRSSDLGDRGRSSAEARRSFPWLRCRRPRPLFPSIRADGDGPVRAETSDRKSTRLNSSHVAISYAVFCLKKKHNFMLILFAFNVIVYYF